jgi:Chalcone isomerase-like
MNIDIFRLNANLFEALGARMRHAFRLSLHLCSSVFICVCMNATAQTAPALPEPVVKDLPGLTLQGDTQFRFIGMKVYDIRLWVPPGGFAPDKPYALELVYNMNFKGADIAQRSIDEKRGQGYGPEEKLTRWKAEMARIFPDIKPGDTLIGVHLPGKEARFYTRNKFLSTVTDPEFARAFFDIWLSEKTSEPKMRARLLEKK